MRLINARHERKTDNAVDKWHMMSEEESQRIAEDFVKSSPTFVFDGIEGTLELTNTLRPGSGYLYLNLRAGMLAMGIEPGKCSLR